MRKALAFAALVLAATPDETLTEFLAALKQAVRAGDRAAVARMVEYPARRIWNGRKHVRIETPEEFVAAYDRIVDFRLKRTIERADADHAFRNDQGIMFDRGRLWLRYDDEPRIITINSPTMWTFGESHPLDADEIQHFPGLTLELLGDRQFRFTSAHDAKVLTAPSRFTLGRKRYSITVSGPRYILRRR